MTPATSAPSPSAAGSALLVFSAFLGLVFSPSSAVSTSANGFLSFVSPDMM
jgi:hypothetical protein